MQRVPSLSDLDTRCPEFPCRGVLAIAAAVSQRLRVRGLVKFASHLLGSAAPAVSRSGQSGHQAAIEKARH